MRPVGSFVPVAPHAPHPSMRCVGLRLALPVGILVGVGATGCAAPGKDTAVVNDIQPTSAYSDRTSSITLKGSNLRPPLDIDTHSGGATVGPRPFAIVFDPVAPVADRHAVDALDVIWVSSLEIDARVPGGLPAGSYRVAVADARGAAIESRAVFTSLGPDNDPPRITFLEPQAGATVGPGAPVLVVAMVDDGQGVVDEGRWAVDSPSLGLFVGGKCKILDKRCRCNFDAPPARTVTEPLTIHLDVQDAVGQPASATLQIQVAWTPEITSVSPDLGPTTGGTSITVRGRNLVPDLSQILIDGHPIGGGVDGDTITAITQAHPPGRAAVSLGNGNATSASVAFEFVPAPTVRLVSPTHAPSAPDTQIVVAGNDFTDDTRFFIVQDGATTPVTSIASGAPPPPPPYAVSTTNRRYILTLGPGAGTIALRAHDDVGGDTDFANAFTYDPPP